VRGHEQAGRRPVLVLSIDAFNDAPLVVTVVVGTSGSRVTRDYPSNVRVSPAESGLGEETVFLCFQLRSLAHARFPAHPTGAIGAAKLVEVEQAVRYCLGL
jgi:mRNA interferase MazF